MFAEKSLPRGALSLSRDCYWG